MGDPLRILPAVVAFAVTAMAATGCGDDGKGGSGTTAVKTDATAAAATPAFESAAESGLPVGYPEPKPEKLRLAYISPTEAAETAHLIAQSFVKATEALGGEATVLDGALNPAKQISLLEQAVNQNYDGIAIFPLDARALGPGIEKAKQAGIPIIAIEYNNADPAQIGDLTSQIVMGTDRLAYEQVKELHRRVGAGGKVVQVTLDTPAPVIRAVAERTAKWAKAFKLDVLGEVVTPTDDAAGGEKIGTEIFARYPDVQGVLVYVDSVAIGVAAAARQRGKRALPVVGNFGGASDGLGAIKAGRLTASVLFTLPEVGKFAAWGLYDANQSDAPLPKTVTVSKPKPLDKDNVDQLTG